MKTLKGLFRQCGIAVPCLMLLIKAVGRVQISFRIAMGATQSRSHRRRQPRVINSRKTAALGAFDNHTISLHAARMFRRISLSWFKRQMPAVNR